MLQRHPLVPAMKLMAADIPEPLSTTSGHSINAEYSSAFPRLWVMTILPGALPPPRRLAPLSAGGIWATTPAPRPIVMPVSRTPAPSQSSAPRSGALSVGGKFLSSGGKSVWLNGIAYGPFAPNGEGAPFPDDVGLTRDLEHIHSLGFNLLRIYDLPTPFLLRETARLGLYLLVGIPWTDHVDFLADGPLCAEIRRTVIGAVGRLSHHDHIAGFLVGNEIEKTLTRWMGPLEVREFLENLIDRCRDAAPERLFAYATYPSTEYLMPRNADFCAANLYLESPTAMDAYLLRLQNLAGNRPLVITEFGLDVLAHGEEAQQRTAIWFRDSLLRAGTAGGVWFSYTDEWFRGGRPVIGWQFGLVDAQRTPRPLCQTFPTLPMRLTAGADAPRISVVVCTYNGSSTLARCLDSLQALSYPNYEVIVIDDGSTDPTPKIVAGFPKTRYIRQDHAGLSAARNLGASSATGEIIAYTDDDCIAHPDWLLHLHRAFQDPVCIAAGGPNIPPPPRNQTERVVAAAPGAPAHVLLNDTEAEHLPGCNLAIRRDVLLRIGGFRPRFRAAGDDVDICWRLRDTGGKLRFVPGAMVWHHRRFSIGAYLRQQRGYGDAEAHLMKEHPQRFGPLGGARWSGCIYGDTPLVGDPLEGLVYHGTFGNALFQGIYAQANRWMLDWFSGLIWIALAVLALCFQQNTIAALLLISGLAAAVIRAQRLPRPPFPLGIRGTLLLWILCLLQPLVREWARLRGMLRLSARPAFTTKLAEVFHPSPPTRWTHQGHGTSLTFWSTTGFDRNRWLDQFKDVLNRHHIAFREDDGWRRFDLELYPSWPISPSVISVTEYHGDERTLTRIRVFFRCAKWLIVTSVALTLLAAAPWTPIAAKALLCTPLIAITSFALALKGRLRALLRESLGATQNLANHGDSV